MSPAPVTDPSVAAAARSARVALRRRASRTRAAGMRAYFKRDVAVAFYGVTLPDVRAIARRVWDAHRGTWLTRDAVRFCDVLVRDREFEAKAVGVLTLARWHSTFPRGLVRTVRSWLGGGHCASWAAVDLVAPSLLTPLIARDEGLLATVAGWTSARSVWVRRAVPVALVPLARRGEALDVAFGTAVALRGDREDLIHKAVGWMLREAGKTDAARLERFLRRRGPELPRTTVRYAIERFPERRRRALLVATR